MQPATSMNIRKVMDEEAKRERFASWYITLPEIPEYEKEMIEKSLKYNVWKELLTLFVIYMILSLAWFFGAGLYDPFQSITGYKLTGKKKVIAVVQEDGQSLSLKDPNKGEYSILMETGFRRTGKKKRMVSIISLPYCRKNRYRK